MNGATESMLRFIHLTSAGLLAGSLGFADTALVPGWEKERPENEMQSMPQLLKYLNAIGPIAVASSVTLAIASRGTSPRRRVLDVLSSIGLAGVLATTTLVTVPIGRKIGADRPLDYPSDARGALSRNWSRARSVRTALGVGAFLLAAASNAMRKQQK
jgi:hypothetical protein